MDDIVDRYRARTPGSAARHAEACKWLPGGDSRTVISHRPYPLYVDHASGAYLTDVDGNRYLDLLGNYTSMVHGHAHPAIVEAMTRQAARGTGYAAATDLQVELARLLVSRVPGLDLVRFCNSGTEATLNALRAARAVTGRDAIVKFEGGYHGSHDLVEISVAPDPDRAGDPRRPGPVPEEPGIPNAVIDSVHIAPFNDLDATERVVSRAAPAAIIVEPMLGASGTIPPATGFLAGLRRIADESGALLVFDEVITFRLAVGGLQSVEGVEPDLTTFGKIVGGGLPVGAFGGRRQIMDLYAPPEPSLVQSGTFNANPMTMAAGLAAIDLLDETAISTLNSAGNRFAGVLRGSIEAAGLRAQVTGHGSLWTIHWTRSAVIDYRSKASADPRVQEMFHLDLLNRGVFSAPRGMFALSTVMSDASLDDAAEAIDRSLHALRDRIISVDPYLAA